jgi:hypothetical protein
LLYDPFIAAVSACSAVKIDGFVLDVERVVLRAVL